MYIQVTEAFGFVSYDAWTSTHHVTREPQSLSERLQQGAGHHNSSDSQKLFPVHMLGGLGKEDAWEQRTSIFLAETSTAGNSRHL